jgi:hypothetical protein
MDEKKLDKIFQTKIDLFNIKVAGVKKTIFGLDEKRMKDLLIEREKLKAVLLANYGVKDENKYLLRVRLNEENENNN